MFVYNNFEQRSPEWYQIREGKITSTSVGSILGVESHKKTKDAIENLAMKLAIETVYGSMEDDFISYKMQRGIEFEPLAFKQLGEILNESFIELESVAFIEYNDHIGTSVDGYVSKGKRATAEIKCPDPLKLFKMMITNEIDDEYKSQIQHHLLCSETELCYFFRFCIHRGKPHYYLREIERDETTINLIKQRSEIVIEKKLKYIEKLKAKP